MIKTLQTKLPFVFIIFLGSLIACTPATSQIPTSTNEIETLPAIKAPQESMVTQTSSLNILDLGLAREMPMPAYKRECVETFQPDKDEFERNLQSFSSSGIAVFTDYINENETIILFDLSNGATQTIPAVLDSNTWARSPEISPDRKLLFYVITKVDTKFVLSNSKGESINTFPTSVVKYSGHYYLNVHEWLGNDSVRLLSKNDFQSEDLVVLMFDPFSGQISTLQNDFDGLQPPVVEYAKTPRENHKYLDWGIDPFFDVIGFLLNGANVAYAPDKNFVFYPHREGYDVLYDVKNKKEIANVLIPNWGELPRWSPAGDYISVIAVPPNSSQDNAGRDFYLLSKDGKEFIRLTYLSEEFERVSIKEYAWSPDGKKIAFWLNTDFPQLEDEKAVYELAIVDTTNGNVINYCLLNQSNKVKELVLHAGLLVEPVWSPDSSKILAHLDIGNSLSIGDTLLVDPSKLSALMIMEGVKLGGWMIHEE